MEGPVPNSIRCWENVYFRVALKRYFRVIEWAYGVALALSS